jgi:chemotaxis protein CheD
MTLAAERSTGIAAPAPKIIIGVSDAGVSSNPADVLATYSLGSCIGVAAYDRRRGIAAMLHFQLPTGAADPERARARPLMFADTGMAWLMASMRSLGTTSPQDVSVTIAGGAQMLNDCQIFDIGRRNHASVRKVLWKHQLLIENEDVGGALPRTMFLDAADGTVTIKSQASTNRFTPGGSR